MTNLFSKCATNLLTVELERRHITEPGRSLNSFHHKKEFFFMRYGTTGNAEWEGLW